MPQTDSAQWSDPYSPASTIVAIEYIPTSQTTSNMSDKEPNLREGIDHLVTLPWKFDPFALFPTLVGEPLSSPFSQKRGLVDKEGFPAQCRSGHRFHSSSVLSPIGLLQSPELWSSSGQKEEVLKVGDPQDSQLATVAGISAVTQTALISWVQGSQYTLEGAEDHQINSIGPPSVFKRWSHQVRSRLRSFPSGLWNPFWITYYRFLSCSPVKGLSRDLVGRILEVTRPCWSFSAGVGNLNDSIVRILKEKPERKIRILPVPTWSKGSQESFRRWRPARAETPQQWNKRKAYRVHPYFTDNLKYVR
jgi:hypothetical protein